MYEYCNINVSMPVGRRLVFIDSQNLFEWAWFLSSNPIVCACFNVQCLSLISRIVASSIIKCDVKAVPRSQIICDGMYECFRKIKISARATMSASPFIRGIANKYFEKTSIPDIMKVYGEGCTFPTTRSMRSTSAGKFWKEGIGCRGGLRAAVGLGFVCKQVTHFLM